MADEPRHELYLTPEFAARFNAIEQAALNGDETAIRVYEHLVELIDNLEDGTENGHHPLTDKSWRAEGDLRDGTASEFATDPTLKRGDYRIVWRQLPPQREGGLPVRELVHVGHRRETPDFYLQTLSALERDPIVPLEENEVFGSPSYVAQKGLPSRSAALQTQLSVALARAGMTPLTRSRPLAEHQFGARESDAPESGRPLTRDL
ncbi:hypothetical protein EV646_11226 [Kribbella antiqua]|uniref:Uncharacterized protein n=1 Tax=Kribbella antiqua TaxID=2512217 RepID=A0A4V2S389_9ACTN|nr:hypothetical protein [Kribbella antiqua]TCO43450.1 hypothetical protein EV646_11226 [Kribbella antiqua]